MIRFEPDSMASARKQRGAVLFVALIFLILMTLLALTATGTSILQEKMTGNMRNSQLGMMGAESAARGGEQFLWQLSYDYTSGQPLPPCASNTVAATNCVYRPLPTGGVNPLVQAFRTSKTWVPAPPNQPAYAKTLTGNIEASETASLADQPVIALENLGPDLPLGSGQQMGVYDPEQTTLAGKHEFYRITARSQGGTGAVLRVVESVYSAVDLSNTGTNPGAPTP